MHFAPQWVKPIKPTGSALTPTAEAPPLAQQKVAPAAIPSSPFPALGQPRSGSPNHGNNGGQNQPLSYSRVTHTPASPSYGGEGYFPYAGGDAQNGNSDPSPFPFRYSREQILAVWDEDKFKERPIELMQIGENGAVIVSKEVTKPVGLRELTELEKKVRRTRLSHALTSAASLHLCPPSYAHASPSAAARSASKLGFAVAPGPYDAQGWIVACPDWPSWVRWIWPRRGRSVRRLQVLRRPR